MDNKEPYRATKLWNEVILAFQTGMPIKKHRRKMHTYNNCFMGSDAITWLHCYLLNNPNFGHDVTRQQTISLLGKFLKCHVVESITFKSKKCEFSDSSHLYRFTPISPQQIKTLPLRLVQSPVLSRMKPNNKENQSSVKISKKYVPEFQKENIPECLFVEKKISLSELGSIWKSTTLERLKGCAPSNIITDILDEKFISGHVIKHNVCRISKTGVVSLIDKTDDIPHWIISAMKCLANWPNASGSGSCLPNYPGFEKDVFKVVRDFFINPQEPLLPTYLSFVMLTVFSHYLKDYIKPHEESKSFKDKKINLSNKNITVPLNVKTSTPVSDYEKERISSQNIALPENIDGRLLLDDPEMMWDYPSTVYFETNFATSNPVTKMRPTSQLTSLSYDQYGGSIESISTISVCSINPESNSLNHYPIITHGPIKNWNSVPCLQDERKISCSRSLQLEKDIVAEQYVRKNHSMFDYFCMSNKEEKLNDSTCSSKTITEDGGMPLYGINTNEQICMSSHSNQIFTDPVLSEKMSSHLSNLPEAKSIKMDCSLKLFENVNYPSELIVSFQLMLLFLNPPNRRQLHLLFRVINKILKNKKFVLDVDMPMRDYLLHTFLPAIVQSDFNQAIMCGMVSFLLDNCEALFQPPSDLKEEVDELCKLRNSRIIYSMDDACSLTYCELVSKQQYEEQKVTVSTEALKGLLSNILLDNNLSEKEKKRRIKQFKENHPDVYQDIFPGKQDPFTRSKSTFLNKLANLRM